MSKKKLKKASSAAGNTPSHEITPNTSLEPWWPSEFARPRTAFLAGMFLLVWSVLLFLAGSYNSLLWVKRLQLIILGVYNPVLLAGDAGSWDVAAVLWGLGAFGAAAVVHPALGLIVLMLLRPWLDAYTYPTDNIYFTWAVLVMLLLWGRTAKHKVPVFLFIGFFACILLSTYTSIHYDKSFRAAVFWAGHLALFVVVLSLARERRIFNLLLVGFCVTVATEVLYAIPHYKLLLPYLRRTLMENPAWLMATFGTTEISPELAHRFNVNRAFGNMLFPNALAGFYILALPGLAALLWLGLGQFRQSLATLPKNSAPSMELRRRALIASAVGWLVTCAVVFVMGTFVSVLVPQQPGTAPTSLWLIATGAVVAGIFVAAGLFLLVLRGGLRLAGEAVWALGALLLAPAVVYSLYSTFSRASYLALVAACAIGATVYFAPKLRSLAGVRKLSAALLLLLFLSLSPVLLGADSAPPSAAAPPATVTESGVDLSVQDLASTSTFHLRLSYWRVGWRMLGDYWTTGTGLAAFEMPYPKYQYFGAGEVREVHNSVLQMFIETGVLGGIFFLLFWGYILLWGLRRILPVENPKERLLLCGLYTGMLAFLGHSLMEIHFSHHGLIFFLLIVTGLFMARAAGQDAQPAKVSIPRWGVLVILGFCAIVSGLGLQFYLRDIALSRGSWVDIANYKDTTYRMQVADFFLKQVSRSRWDKEMPPLQISYAATYSLIPNREKIESFATLYVPTGQAQNIRRLRPDEDVPPNAVLRFEHPGWAVFHTLEYGEIWLENWERIDSTFPHSAQLATWMGDMYISMFHAATGKAKGPLRGGYAEKGLAWHMRALERTPTNAEPYMNTARATHTKTFLLEEADEKVPLLRDSIAYVRDAFTLSPLSTEIPFTLAWYLEDLAGLLSSITPDNPEILALRDEAAHLRAKAKELIDRQVDLKRPAGQKKYEGTTWQGY